MEENTNKIYKNKWLKIITINFIICMLSLLAIFILTLVNSLIYQVIGKVEFIIIYAFGIVVWIVFIILNKVLILEDKDFMALTIINKKDKEAYISAFNEEKCSTNGAIINVIKNVLDYYLVIVIALLCVICLFTFVLFPAEVNQHSMEPTLSGGGVNNDGDRVLVFKTKNIEKGDIIVFSYDREIQFDGICDDGELLIKRVIASEGDTFSCINGQVYVNGELESESYVHFHEADTYDLYSIIGQNSIGADIMEIVEDNKIPEGYILVLGDNRANSNDSEEFGLVKLSQVEGKVKFYKDDLGWHKMD